MSALPESLERFAPWREPRRAAGAGPFTVRCVIEPPASLDEIHRAWSGVPPAEDAVELWKATRTARLFEDVDHGQWGPVLLPPADAARRTSDERRMRPGELTDSDVVIGEFLGDQELLVAAPGEGQILVALPLDPRPDWYRVASTLPEFLERFADTQGAKFWEPYQQSIVDLPSDPD